jgi:hypothetical protein
MDRLFVQPLMPPQAVRRASQRRVTAMVMALLGLAIACRSNQSVSDQSTSPAVTIGGSAVARSHAEAGATLTLKYLSPASGETIDKESMIEADLAYAVRNPYPGARYVVLPFVERVGGKGNAFSPMKMKDAPLLSDPAGDITLEYPIGSVLNDANVRRPVTVWIDIVERKSASIRVVARVGPFVFPAS